MRSAVNELARGAADVEWRAAPWIQRFARFGYAAKGVVYCLIALLAVRAAFGSARATDSRGALAALINQPFGRISLAIVAIGLFAFALWTLYQGVRNPEANALINRIGQLGTAVVHVGLALTAARFALNGRGDVNDAEVGARSPETASRWTADVLQHPLGRWIIIGIGIGLIVHALWQLYCAITAQLDEQLDLSTAAPQRRVLLVRVARFGVAARGLVFLVIGLFCLRAGLRFDAREVRGLGGALQAIEQQPLGPWLLGIVAVGLFAFGLYELIRARYRIILPRTALPPTRIRLRRSGA